MDARTRFARATIALSALTSICVDARAVAAERVTVEAAEAFVPLASIPGITGIAPIAWTSRDNAWVRLPIGFAFHDSSETDATEVLVDTNGLISFDATHADSVPTNIALGAAGKPNRMFAGFWDDLVEPLSAGSYGRLGAAPNRIVVIELAGFSHADADGFDEGNVQFWLYEGASGRLDVCYGGQLSSQNFDATVGWESVGGTPFSAFRDCGAIGACTSTDFAGLSGRRFRTELALSPELSGSLDSFPHGARPGTTPNGRIDLENRGSEAAARVAIEVYLSLDDALDPATDYRIGTATVTLPGASSVAMDVALSIPNTLASPSYRAILAVDTDEQFREIDEGNNTVLGPTFRTEHDLVPTGASVASPRPLNPGETTTFDIDILNDGVPFAGTIDIELSVSGDSTGDARLVATLPVELEGTLVETHRVEAVLPSVGAGEHVAIVRVDAANGVDEADETNNTFVGTVPFRVGPDLTASATFGLPSGALPGDTATFTTTLRSIGAPYSGDVEYRLYVSSDGVFQLARDRLLGTFHATLGAAGDTADMEQVALPADLDGGTYFVVVHVDPNDRIAELDERNDLVISSASFTVGVDFHVQFGTVSVGPAELQTGDTVDVAATLQSLGAAFRGNVPVRLYFSLDETFDEGDLRVADAQVFFSGLSTAGLSTRVVLPPIPAGAYRPLLVVDPDGLHSEADEMNNAMANEGTVTVLGADIRIVSVSVSPIAFSGVEQRVRFELENTGRASARGFRYAYFLSDNDICRITDPRVFLSELETLPSGVREIYEDRVLMPTVTATQSKWFCAIVDVFSQVPETSESNNVRVVATPLRIIFPIANLGAEIVASATIAAAGEELAITRILANDGVADASTFTYTYVLSSNPIASADDVVIASFALALPMASEDFGVDFVRIPPTVRRGTYHLGLRLDPDGVIDEVDEDDNDVIGAAVDVRDAAIRFLSVRELPDAALDVPYEAIVHAVGGTLPLVYTVAGGALPAGLAIDATTGIIAGTPTTDGLFHFAVRAQSGTVRAEEEFTLRVRAPTAPLEVANPWLPTAITGRTYSTKLVAVGGTPPYRWSSSDAMPPGLVLDADGHLGGIARAAVDATITFTVRDALDGIASDVLLLRVVDADDSLRISVASLPHSDDPATIGRSYERKLEAAYGPNACASCRWSILGAVPAGMALGADGTFDGTPSAVGRTHVVVRVQDTTGAYDTAQFVFHVVDKPLLAITTLALPSATLGSTYQAELAAIRGDPPYAFEIVEGLGDGLPPGITFDAARGAFAGNPTTVGAYAFVARVTDSSLRSDMQPLSIEVIDEATAADTNGGCACETSDRLGDTSRSSALLWIVLFACVLVFRRKRSDAVSQSAHVSVPLAIAFLWMSPNEARADYEVELAPHAYTRLANPTVVHASGDDVTRNIVLPFDFVFYGTPESVVAIGTNGAIAFGDGRTVSFRNGPLGSTTNLDGFIAPFWTDLELSDSTALIGYEVSGDAPQRIVAIEYRNISLLDATTSRINFVVRLHEGLAGRIDVDYGSVRGIFTGDATMGMEAQDGLQHVAFAPSRCTDDCDKTDLQALENTRSTMFLDPGVELLAEEFDAPSHGYLELPFSVSYRIRNLHGAAVGPFGVAIRASKAPDGADAIDLYAATTRLGPFQTQHSTIPVTLPSSVGEGDLHLFVVVDSAASIDEADEHNNRLFATHPLRVRSSGPDLGIVRVDIEETSVAAGESLIAHATATNGGAVSVNGARLAFVLSSNDVVTPSDDILAEIDLSLASGETRTATAVLTLSATTHSGTYTLGAYIDPHHAIDEIDETNNARASSARVTVAGSGLALTTTRLPNGRVGARYEGFLSAVGGDGEIAWSIARGQLPQGLALVASTGVLYGRPRAAETQNFLVRATSGSTSREREFSIDVRPKAEPLGIVSREIPTIVAGQEFLFFITAAGGEEDVGLTWSATGLPLGIATATTSDATESEPSRLLTLLGTTNAIGEHSVEIEVTDGVSSALRTFAVRVAPPDTLLIVPKTLSTARLGQAYAEELESTGGIEPVTWVHEFGLPDGLSLAPSGVIAGTPRHVGIYRFGVQALDTTTHGASSTDRSEFEIVVLEDEHGLHIATTSLETAIVGEPFSQAIVAEGGVPDYAWRIDEGALPDGLEFSSDSAARDLVITGVPVAAGTTNLLVVVVDSEGREAARPFALRVVDAAQTADGAKTDGGCNCRVERRGRAPIPGGIAAFAALVLMTFARRRRLRSRSRIVAPIR